MNSQIGSLPDENLEEWWKKILGIARGEVRLLTKQEAWSWIQGWRLVYARAMHEKAGRWVLPDHEWHVMSYGYAIHVSGAAAEEHYLALNSEATYLVYLEHCPIPMCHVSVGDLPSLEFLHCLYAPEGGLCDIYVFAADYSWTFVITHEPDIGPFFSRREWQKE
jgi:hypothetical protein